MQFLFSVLKNKVLFSVLLLGAFYGSFSFIGIAHAASIPTVNVQIKQNGNIAYFSPTYVCIRGDSAIVQLKNETKNTVSIQFPTSGSSKQYLLKPGKTLKQLEKASPQTEANTDYEIDATVNQSTQNEKELFITANGVVKGCL